MLTKLRHIGVVVKDLERAVARFEAFGLHHSEIMELKQVGVRIAFFPIGDTLIEFLHYTGTDAGEDNIVRSQTGPINHLCFQVEDLQASIDEFRRNGAELADGFPRAGAHGTVAFFRPETTEGILLEICQL